MSDILFVEHLGDAFEAAITGPMRSERRRRRKAAVALAVLCALLLVAAAVAHVLSTPDELATRGVACYTSADLRSDVTVVPSDRAPVAACADAYRRMGQPVPQLVACADDSSVAVIPGVDESACAAAHLAPLPRGSAASQAKVTRLSLALLTLEAAQECVSPNRLARRVDRVLSDEGWAGWKSAIRSSLGGPCGTVSTLDGAGRRSIDGALDATTKTVLVSGAPTRSTVALLYGAGGFARELEDASAARCFTADGLTALTRTRAEASGRTASLELAPPLGGAISFGDGREARYRAGCAVVIDVHAAPDGRNLVVVVPRPR